VFNSQTPTRENLGKKTRENLDKGGFSQVIKKQLILSANKNSSYNSLPINFWVSNALNYNPYNAPIRTYALQSTGCPKH